VGQMPHQSMVLKNALLRREVSSMDKTNERTSFSNEPPFQTNLLPLEFRREILDLQLFYKSKNRLIPMDVNNYLRTYDPGYTLRNYDENNFYFITKHKQDYFRNSFFVRSANLWNSLSSQLKSCTSISVFSSRLRKMYKELLLFYSPPGCS
jgi:hypothetical protein